MALKTKGGSTKQMRLVLHVLHAGGELEQNQLSKESALKDSDARPASNVSGCREGQQAGCVHRAFKVILLEDGSRTSMEVRKLADTLMDGRAVLSSEQFLAAWAREGHGYSPTCRPRMKIHPPSLSRDRFHSPACTQMSHGQSQGHTKMLINRSLLRTPRMQHNDMKPSLQDIVTIMAGSFHSQPRPTADALQRPCSGLQASGLCLLLPSWSLRFA